LPAFIAIDPKDWRKRAEEARALSDKMSDPLAKEMMLRIAKEYELIPESARRTDEHLATKKVTHSPSRRRKLTSPRRS
jgi:hypothetical protein